MISKKDKIYILNLVKKHTPEILKVINFDPSVKEVGHSFGDRYEDELVSRLLKESSDFTEPTEKRSPDDLKYKGNFINIKFGYKKNGQPNICSMKRLFMKLHTNEIDSYYLISVDAYGPDYKMFDVYDYLDYTNFNYGTGQLMLCESKLNKVYDFNKEFNLTKKEKIVIMGNMMRKELDRHKELKENQQMIIDRIKNSYESSLLQG